MLLVELSEMLLLLLLLLLLLAYCEVQWNVDILCFKCCQALFNFRTRDVDINWKCKVDMTDMYDIAFVFRKIEGKESLAQEDD